MNTQIIKINKDDIDPLLIEPSRILKSGGLVAFPTETVYGLGGNALDKNAAQKIYKAKGRPSDNPLIVHIGKHKQIEDLARDIPEQVYPLINRFWPGPLTIILKKKEIVPDETTGGLDTVAIRMPDNIIAQKLINNSGVYLAAPSANTSGRPSPTSVDHVIEDLYGKVDIIIDGGKSPLGIESTIVDFTEDIPTILRPGFINKDQIKEVIKELIYDVNLTSKDQTSIAKAPGMKYKHYAPKGKLYIYEGEIQKVTGVINEMAKSNISKGKRVGIIATNETKEMYRYGEIKIIGSRVNEETIAASLYSILREFDELNIDIIYTETFTEGNLADAIMNRLLKAAGYNIIKL